MWMTLLKGVGTAAVVILISEIAKRWSGIAAAIAALPLMTMLVVANLALDKAGGIDKANQFAMNFFYLFWPGLLFFIILPVAQKLGAPFWVAFGVGVVATLGVTWGAIVALKAWGVKVD